MRLRIAKSVGRKRLAVDGIAASTGPIARSVLITASSSLTAAFTIPGVNFRTVAIAGASTLAAAANRTIPRTVAIAAQSSLAASTLTEVAPTLVALNIVDEGSGFGSMTLTFAAEEGDGTPVNVRLFIRSPTDPTPSAGAVWSGAGAAATAAVSTTIGATGVSISIIGEINGTFLVDAVARYVGGTALSNVVSIHTAVAFNTATASWNVVAGDTTATITSFPPIPGSPAWAVTVGDTTATITDHPGAA
jgi:hypothetical protein